MTSCKGRSQVDCNKLDDCKYTTGLKRQYCRKKRNTRKTKLKSKTPREYGPVKGRCKKGYRKNKTTKMCKKPTPIISSPPISGEIIPEKDKLILNAKPFKFCAACKLDDDNDYRFSNFYNTNCHYDGLIYPSTEHAYQSLKFSKEERVRFAIGGDLASFSGLSFFYKKEADVIKKTKHWSKKNMIGIVAKLAQNNWKKAGLSQIGSVPQAIFYPLLLDKFNRNEALKTKLIGTGSRYLVEFCISGERRERQGKGRERWCAYAKDLKNGTYQLFGENRMGMALMTTRDHFLRLL
jgi:predicted NAD-dependent protein-ADP-ribosyltransferase YbiA (DUF1768 family)